MLTTIQKTRLTNAVDRGIAKLTQHEGSLVWVDLIDLKTLHMVRGSSCMIGQLNGGAYDPSGMLGITNEQAVRFGFAVPLDTSYKSEAEAYHFLTTVWVSKVKKIQKTVRNLVKKYGGA